MSRKSAAALSLAVELEELVTLKPSPPKNLLPEEAEMWNLMVDVMPPDWFPPETHVSLELLCQQVRVARVLAESLRNISSESIGAPELERINAFERVSKLIMGCVTKLRLTNQSRHMAMKAETEIKKRVKASPWDDD